MSTEQTEGKEDFASLIAQAEKAVENVKEPHLKEVAFGRILDHLLSSADRLTGNQSGNSTRKNTAKPVTNSTKTEGPLAWLRELVDEGFFKKPKSSKNIQDELDNRSHKLRAPDLTLPLQKLCREKKLRRDRIAPAEGEKKVLHWFKW